MLWVNSCIHAEDYYHRLLKIGWTAQEARDVLPNALKTEIVMTCNAREMLHIFKLRTSPKAHPQFREIMLDGQRQLAELMPVIFGTRKE